MSQNVFVDRARFAFDRFRYEIVSVVRTANIVVVFAAVVLAAVVFVTAENLVVFVFVVFRFVHRRDGEMAKLSLKTYWNNSVAQYK